MSLMQMSFSGGAVILVIVFLRSLALYWLPKRFFAVLWNLPLIRLLIPFSIPAAFSVYSLLEKKTLPSSAATTAPVTPHVSDILPGKTVTTPLDLDVAMPPIHLFSIIWLSGMLICMIFFISAYLKCHRVFRESLPVSNDYGQTWLQGHRLHRTISLRYSDRISAPVTYGIFHPVILVPKSTDWNDSETLRYVLAHELVHICRFDTLRKLILVLALCIHWFNPLAWVMYVLANRDMELACDEMVLRQFGGSSSSKYALALIRMEERKSGLLLGSHFSKNSIEERIQAIMKKKKNSLAVLLAALVLTGGATAFFATSAKAEKQSDKAPQMAYTSSEEDTLLIWDKLAGTASYSSNGGETWFSLSEEELEEISNVSNVEWWTEEEYAAWLEEEKIELQSIVGSKGWTPSTGWFTWTKEMVAETIAKYEETLALIQEGYLISKTVDGSEDTMMVMNPLDRVLSEGIYEETMGVEDNSNTNSRAVDYENLFAEYKHCGLTFDNTDDNLYWNGRRVRIFIDGVEHESGFFSQYEHYDPEGQIDLHTIRERVVHEDGSYDLMGPLVRIEEFEPGQMFLDALEGQRYVNAEIQYESERTADELERYAPFGLTFKTNANTGELVMSWNGKPVRSLFDPERQLWIANSLGVDGVDLEATYKAGKLLGLRISENQDREFVETGAIINVETTIASGEENVSGETIAQRMEKYAPYGVTYEERSGKRTIRYNGQIVSSFTDKGPDAVFSVQSTDAGFINLRTVYDSKGRLGGVEVVN